MPVRRHGVAMRREPVPSPGFLVGLITHVARTPEGRRSYALVRLRVRLCTSQCCVHLLFSPWSAIQDTDTACTQEPRILTRTEPSPRDKLRSETIKPYHDSAKSFIGHARDRRPSQFVDLLFISRVPRATQSDIISRAWAIQPRVFL